MNNKRGLKPAIFLPKNRRGQDGSPVGTIIAVIMAIFILVMVIFAATGTFGNLAFWLPKDNIQTMVTQCTAACSPTSVYNFCRTERTLRIPGDILIDGKKTREIKGNCSFFVNTAKGTLNDLATFKYTNADAGRTAFAGFEQYGFSSCSVDCAAP